MYGVQNVVYRATDGHVHGLYWSTGAVGHDDLSNLGHAPNAAGDPVAYFINGQVGTAIVYRGVDGHLQRLYCAVGPVGHDDLTVASGAAAGWRAQCVRHPFGRAERRLPWG